MTEPGIEALIERSSLGTPGAKLLRASTSQAVVDAILVKAAQITRTSALLTEDGHPRRELRTSPPTALTDQSAWAASPPGRRGVASKTQAQS